MRCAYPSPLGFQSLATEIPTPPSDHIPLSAVLFVVPVVAAPIASAARRFAGANADLSTGDRRPTAGRHHDIASSSRWARQRHYGDRQRRLMPASKKTGVCRYLRLSTVDRAGA